MIAKITAIFMRFLYVFYHNLGEKCVIIAIPHSIMWYNSNMRTVYLLNRNWIGGKYGKRKGIIRGYHKGT